MGRRRQGDRAWYRWDRSKQAWLVTSIIDGERTRTTHSTEAEAQREVRKVMAAVDTGQLDCPVTWDDAMTAFLDYRRERGDRPKTVDQYAWRLKAVAKTLGLPDPLTLSRRDGKEHRRIREGQGRSPVTIAAEINTVREAQRWFVSRGWMRTATWDDVPLPDVEDVDPREHLLPSEVGPWLRAAERLGECPPRYSRAAEWERWPAAAWLLVHGLCKGELRRLRVKDIDLVTGVVYVRSRRGKRTKSRNRARPVPIQARRALDVLLRTFEGLGPEDVCFPNRNGGELEYSTHWFSRRVDKTCEEAGVRRVTTHGLRHTAGTLLCSLPGVGTFDAGKMLGHADARVTDKVYSHSAVGPVIGPAQALGTWLDRAYDGKPELRVVSSSK